MAADGAQTDEDKIGCGWSNCTKDRHSHEEMAQIEEDNTDYTRTGVTARGAASTRKSNKGEPYGTEWKVLEPWVIDGNGYDLINDEAKNENEKLFGSKKGKRYFVGRVDKDDAEITSKYFKRVKSWILGTGRHSIPGKEHLYYPTAKHHIICHCFFNFSGKGKSADYEIALKDLKHNLIISGWNLNDRQNGICLPRFRTDIYRHKLQAHTGSHIKTYYTTVLEELTEVNDDFKDICEDHKNHQVELLDAMDDLSVRLGKSIKRWTSSTHLQKLTAADQIKKEKLKLKNMA